jgi:hypothetical protein
MITLGIRAEPTQATFAIYDSELKSIINIEKIIIPAVLSKPEQLKFARNTILDILREFKVNCAGVRVTEGNAQNKDTGRLFLEAIFMESFASSNISSYFIGRKTSISSKLNISIQEYNEIVTGNANIKNTTGWPTTKIQPPREAIMVAMAAAL